MSRFTIAVSFIGVVTTIISVCSSVPALPQSLTNPCSGKCSPGTINGSADVTLSGSSSYTIPILVAPGSGGTAPKITLAYDSQAPSGVLGAGWSISGLSKITRGPKNLRTDNVIQGPQFNDPQSANADALYLDGQRLIPVPAGQLRCGLGAGFIKEIDDQTCIEFKASGFVAHTKAGLTMQYGMTNDGDANGSVVTLANKNLVLLWACNRIEDSAGNYIDFFYSAPNSSGDFNIDKIVYTGNSRANKKPYASISFTYDNQATAQLTWVAGNLVKSTSQLVNITTTTQANPENANDPGPVTVASYAFRYAQTGSLSRFLLSSIIQSGSDGTPYNATNFAYVTPPKATEALWWQDNTQGGYGSINDLQLTVQDNLASGYKFISIKLQSDPDDKARLHAFYAAAFRGRIEQAALKNTPTGFQKWPSAAFPSLPGLPNAQAVFSVGGEDLGAAAIDLDGQESPYLFVPYLNGGTYSLHVLKFDARTGQEKWSDVSSNYQIPLAADGMHVPHLLAGHIFGTGALDILSDSAAFKNAGPGGGLTPMPGFAPPYPLDGSAHLIDVNCDGKAELVYFGGGHMLVYTAGPNGWVAVPSSSPYIPPIPQSTPAAAIREIPGFNNCPGLLVADGTQTPALRAAFSTSQAGWASDTVHKPSFLFVDAQGNDAHAVITKSGVSGPNVEVLAYWQPANGQPLQIATTLVPGGFASPPPSGPPKPLGTDNPGGAVPAAFVGDVNSDGWPDVIYFSNSRYQDNQVYIYAPGAANPWPDPTNNGPYNPPVPFAQQSQVDTGVRFVDLHGTGRQDVIFSSTNGSGQTTGGAEINTGCGWVSTSDLVPPNGIAISATNVNMTNSVQLVDVNGDGYVDFVYGLSDGGTSDGKAGVYLNQPGGSPIATACGAISPRKFLQTADATYALPPSVLLGDKSNGDLGVRFVDLDGDGRVDIIYSRMESNGQVVTGAYLNNGHGWDEADEYKAPTQVPFVVMPSGSGPNSNNPANFAVATQVQFIDVNGDGLPDLVFSFAIPFQTGTRVQGVCLNAGKGNGWPKNFSDCTKYNVPAHLDQVVTDGSISIQYLDLNGDGLTDIVVTQAGGGTATCTYLGRGIDPLASAAQSVIYPWSQSCDTAWNIPAAAISPNSGDPGYRLVDVNGDGLPDIVYNWQAAANAPSSRGIFLNTGGSWSPPLVPNAWAFPQPFSLANGNDTGVRIVDVNGDGLPDVLLSFSDPQNPGSSQTGTWLNTGRRTDVLSRVTDGLGVTTTICYATILEVRTTGTPCNAPNFATRKSGAALGANAAPPPSPVAVYGNDDSVTYPFIRGVPTAYVVQRMSVNEASDDKEPASPCWTQANSPCLSFTYNYGGLKFDARARRSLGYGWRTSLDTIKGITTQVNLAQGDANGIWTAGLTTDTIISCIADSNNGGKCTKQHSSGTAKVLSDAHTDWAANTRGVGPKCPNNPPPECFTVATVSQSANNTQKFDIEGSAFGSEKNVFTYSDDGDLNVTKLVTTRSDGTQVTTENVYGDDASKTHWWLGRLIKTTVTKVGDAGTRPEIRSSCFTYDGNTGLINQETANCGDPFQVSASYERDTFGNIVTKTQTGRRSGRSAPVQTETRITQRAFDDRGRFAITETNPGNLTTRTTYSAAFGTPLSILAPDGSLTRNEYDGFGRLVKHVSPSGLLTTVRFGWLDQVNVSGFDGNALAPSGITYNFARDDCGPPLRATLNPKFARVTKSGELPPSIGIIDPRGREVRKLSFGFGGKAVHKDSQYDQYGRIVLETRPYFAGDLPPAIRNCYDILDRLQELDQPSGETVERQYLGRTTVIRHKFSTGPGGIQTTSITTNERNNPTQVCRLMVVGGKPACPNDLSTTTTYEYDAGDRLLSVAGPKVGSSRATTAHAYDNVGHRESTSDPDLGKWSYEYNAFGELVRQEDAKRQVTTISYDLLGRPTSRFVLDIAGKLYRSDEWDYDKGDYGQGHLSSVSSSNGFRETYLYDSFGRMVSKATSVGPEGFYSVTEYDAYNRVTALGYPNGLVVQYSYDSNGYLSGITNRDSKEALWGADGIDALGRVTAEHFGNGVVTSHSFKQESGYIENVKSAVGSITLQNLTLEYDLAGNLIDRRDQVSSREEKYHYDEFERIVSAGTTQKFQYDTASRMLVKADKKDFEYAAHPYHAPSAYTDAIGLRRTYSYDENGNRIDGPIGPLSYTPENKLERIDYDVGKSSRFEYGPAGGRFRQLEYGAVNIETIYTGIYERSTYLHLLQRTEYHRNYLINQAGVFGVIELTREVNLPFGNVQTNQQIKRNDHNPLNFTPPGFQTRTFYLLKDELGSVVALTGDKGIVKSAFTYDAWGTRKISANPDPVAGTWTRGYSGHEEIASAHFVHMNGRVYDPDLAAFTSPDLVTQTLTDDRTFNRYSYVLNNPFKFVDPTGNSFWGSIGGFFGSVGSAISGAVNSATNTLRNAINSAGQWLQQNWREVAIITLAVGVTVLTAGTASPILAGLIGGATVAGASSALYGGSVGDVFKAAVIGAIFGSLGAGIGDLMASGSWEGVFAQGGFKGLVTASSGGNFLQGFGIGALSALEPEVEDIGGFSGAAIVQIGAQAALNGTVSAIEGEKFGNGALWGAFVQLQIDSNSYQWSQSIQSTAVAGLVNATQTLVQDATDLITTVNALPTTLKGIVAAASFATISTLEVTAGPYDVQTNMLLVANLQQMQRDPFWTGSLTFSSVPTVGPNPLWLPTNQDLSSSYFAGYAYGLSALGSSYVWQSQPVGGSATLH